MKKLTITICMACLYSLLFAQGKMKSTSLDLKPNNGSILKIIPVKNTGVLFDILNLKSLSFDLVFYDMDMKKVWTYTLSKQDLSITGEISMATSSDEIIYSDGQFIYVHVKSGMSKAKSYSVFCIGMDGKLIKKTEGPVQDGSDYKGILTDAGYVYMFFSNGKQNEKQLYYLMQMDPDAHTFNKKITLAVPTLKKGEWSYAGHADGKLFFYGFEDQKTKDNEANGIAVDFAPIADDGQALTPFTVNIKLNQFFAGAEYSVGSQTMVTMGPLANVLVDTSSKAIYIYCHMSDKMRSARVCKTKGVYIEKCSLDGNVEWTKQYANEDIARFNPDVANKEPMSWMYRSSLEIDDSTNDILLVRKEVANLGASDCKCFYFDRDGDLKRAFMGIDQSSRMFNGYIEAPISPLYTSFPYKSGDPTYYKGIQSVFSKYPANKSKPMAYLVNLGRKHWVAVMDGEKNTLDIYEL